MIDRSVETVNCQHHIMRDMLPPHTHTHTHSPHLPRHSVRSLLFDNLSVSGSHGAGPRMTRSGKFDTLRNLRRVQETKTIWFQQSKLWSCTAALPPHYSLTQRWSDTRHESSLVGKRWAPEGVKEWNEVECVECVGVCEWESKGGRRMCLLQGALLCVHKGGSNRSE